MHNGQQEGPLLPEILAERLKAGELSPDTEAWSSRLGRWVSLREMLELETSGRTLLESDFADEEKLTKLEGTDPDSTLLEKGASAGGEGFCLVGRSFQAKDSAYLVCKELEASGAEADVYVVQKEGSEDKQILKFYRRGISPKPETTKILLDLGKEHVAQIYETGEKDGRSYEIQEFIEYGSLADLLTEYPHGVPDTKMREILSQLYMAVEHLHRHNLIHRDLKPSNVLVRSKKPLDLVFIDFGISSVTDFSLAQTGTARTVFYASPQAITGTISKDSDWWSIGVILLELLAGKHPFAGMSEMTVNFQLVDKGIPIPEEVPDEWKLLFKGLLTRSVKKRWGGEQVKRWMEGDRSMSIDYDAEKTKNPELRKYDYKPYHFGGQEFHEPAELALALSENWQEGMKNFGRGFLTDWIKHQLGNQEMAGTLMDIAEEDGLSASQKLTVALAILGPELPPMSDDGPIEKITLDQESHNPSILHFWLEKLGKKIPILLTDSHGNRYEGEFKDGQPNGRGTYFHADGDRYEGEFKDGLRNGHGTLFGSNGDRYEGEFKDGYRNGQGTYFWSNGDRYEGEHKDGMENGHGTLFVSNGDRYEGEHKDGRPNGQGTYFWSSGDRYEGEFKDGMENGQGTYFHADGNRYEGEHKDGRPNGRGTYFHANGNRYEGEYKDGQRNGRGTLFGSNGDRYEGEFKDGYRNGHGTYFWSNGDRYEGEFKDGRRNGHGTFFDASGDRYEGEFKDEMENGQGTYFWSDGDRYEGEYKDGQRNGQGTYFYANGDNYKGVWTRDELTKISPEDAAVMSQNEVILFLDGLTDLSPEVANALTTHKDLLTLDGLTDLSLEVAKVLASKEGELYLNGLTDLSPEVANALSTHKGVLSLDGLTDLSPEAAKVLASTEGELYLDGLTDLSPEVASALSTHKDLLTLNGLTDLRPEFAKVLVSKEGELWLEGLTDPSPEVTAIFSESNCVLYPPVTPETREETEEVVDQEQVDEIKKNFETADLLRVAVADSFLNWFRAELYWDNLVFSWLYTFLGGVAYLFLCLILLFFPEHPSPWLIFSAFFAHFSAILVGSLYFPEFSGDAEKKPAELGLILMRMPKLRKIAFLLGLNVPVGLLCNAGLWFWSYTFFDNHPTWAWVLICIINGLLSIILCLFLLVDKYSFFSNLKSAKKKIEDLKSRTIYLEVPNGQVISNFADDNTKGVGGPWTFSFTNLEHVSDDAPNWKSEFKNCFNFSHTGLIMCKRGKQEQLGAWGKEKEKTSSIWILFNKPWNTPLFDPRDHHLLAVNFANHLSKLSKS